MQIAKAMQWRFPFDSVRHVNLDVTGPFSEEELMLIDEVFALAKRTIFRCKESVEPAEAPAAPLEQPLEHRATDAIAASAPERVAEVEVRP